MEVSPGIIRIAVCNANSAANNVWVKSKPHCRSWFNLFISSFYIYNYVRKLFWESPNFLQKNPLHKMQGMKYDLDFRLVNRDVPESEYFSAKCAWVYIFGCRFKLIDFS